KKGKHPSGMSLIDAATSQSLFCGAPLTVASATARFSCSISTVASTAAVEALASTLTEIGNDSSNEATCKSSTLSEATALGEAKLPVTVISAPTFASRPVGTNEASGNDTRRVVGMLTEPHSGTVFSI